MIQWPDVARILPPCQQGVAKIQHFTVSADEARWAAIRRESISPGSYVRLYVNEQLMMSNTTMEQNTNREVIHRAKGDVLVAGLGIGLILVPILAKLEVDTVTVVEKYQDVIDLVAPRIQHPKLTVVCADIMAWNPPPDQKFDTIYFDIWPDICTDNLKQINTLHRRGARWKKPNAWMHSWSADYLRSLRLRNSQ